MSQKLDAETPLNSPDRWRPTSFCHYTFKENSLQMDQPEPLADSPAHGSLPQKHTREVPAFLIVGTPRSGTTLVQRLACELPGVRVPPETQFFINYAPQLLTRRRFPLDSQALREEIETFRQFKNSRQLILDAEAVADGFHGQCNGVLELFAALLRHVAGPARLYGEKSPRHLLWCRHLARRMPHLKVVAVVRDPRAVVASHLSRGRSVKSHLLLADWWSLDQRELARTLKALGAQRCLILHYEDVVKDPVRAKARLAGLLNLSIHRDELVHPRQVPLSEIAVPAEWWKSNATSNISSKRIGAWRDLLSLRQADDISAICRHEMQLFGYAEAIPTRATAFLRIAQLRPQDRVRRLRFRARRYKYRLGVRRLARRLGPEAPTKGILNDS